MNAEEIVRVFNTQCLPLLTNGMKSGDLCEILKDAGITSTVLWPVALEKVGYAERRAQGAGRAMYFQEDPSHVNMFRPLLINEGERIKELICDRIKLHCANSKNKAKEEKENKRLSSIDERDAITLLKRLGYRVMKPITKYEEV